MLDREAGETAQELCHKASAGSRQRSLTEHWDFCILEVFWSSVCGRVCVCFTFKDKSCLKSSLALFHYDMQCMFPCFQIALKMDLQFSALV